MRAHHYTRGEAGSGRGSPGSGEATASGTLVEAGVDGAFTELFAFGVGAVHEQFAGTGSGGIHLIVEVHTGVAHIQRGGADAGTIQNRMVTLGVYILLHGMCLSALSESALRYADPLSTRRHNQPVSAESR